MDYNEKYSFYLQQIENRLKYWLDKLTFENSNVAKAVEYSLIGAGKRVRGVLVLAVCEMLTNDYKNALDYAVAVEMMHCYSLIHDDLPCMDNDDFRRGKPSCHKKFNEENALLAGDSLNTLAFEVLANAENQSAEQKIKAVQVLASSAGVSGMVYGQELDLFYENKPINEETLKKIHTYKTGKLIECSAILGGVSANASAENIQVISKYAKNIGIVFQIIDDVLDVTSTQDELGKPICSDQANGKTTYITLKGVEQCLALSSAITEESCNLICNNFNEKSDFLVTLAKKLVDRKN